MKKPCHCHVIDSADSKSLGDDPEESLQGRNLKKKLLQGAKPKVPYITGGKALLTLN